MGLRSIPCEMSSTWTDGRDDDRRGVALSKPALLFFERRMSREIITINGRSVEVGDGDCLVLPTGSVVQREALRRIDFSIALSLPKPLSAHDLNLKRFGRRSTDSAETAIARFIAQFPQDPMVGIGRVTVPHVDRQRWRTRLEELRHELTTHAPRGFEAAQALLTLCAVDAARYAVPAAPTGLSRRVVGAVFAYINEHLAAPIGLREIADAVNFSPAYLTNLIKRETGRPIGSWIIELRLRRAEHLLSHTDEPIALVGAAVGYVDANSFGRAFTKRRGMSPWQWRRQHAPTASAAAR